MAEIQLCSYSLRTAGRRGASITLRLSDGEKHRLVWGPGTQGSLVAALVCSRAQCNQYDEAWDLTVNSLIVSDRRGAT